MDSVLKKKVQISSATLLMLALFISAIAIGGIYTPTHQNIPTVSTVNEEKTFQNEVCYTWYHSNTGETENLGCDHNTVTNLGTNFSLELLTGVDLSAGSSADVGNGKYIGLSNLTDTIKTAAVLSGEFDNSAGLGRAAATCAANSQGNVSCWKVFTFTATQAGVAASGLNFNATGNSLIAYNNLSLSVNGLASDQLTVNWTITQS